MTHPITPLAGPSHLHTYSGGWHIADNLPGGAKNYYGISAGGDITGIRLRVGTPPNHSTYPL